MSYKVKCEKYEKFLKELRDLLEQRIRWCNTDTNMEELQELLQEIKDLLDT